jgi:hypothetical protein
MASPMIAGYAAYALCNGMTRANLNKRAESRESKRRATKEDPFFSSVIEIMWWGRW